jgi:hypothetical protein
MGFVSSFLIRKLINVEPIVAKEGQLLIIKTGWRGHLLSLGAASRKVTVDPVSKIVRLKGRRFWFFGWSRRIEYDWIQQISYGYTGFGGWGWGEGTTDDLFSISLDLKNNTHVVLCRFFGSGDFYNNTIMPDWWYYGDQLLADVSRGTQEQNSSALVNLLENMIGVPVVNPS